MNLGQTSTHGQLDRQLPSVLRQLAIQLSCGSMPSFHSIPPGPTCIHTPVRVYPYVRRPECALAFVFNPFHCQRRHFPQREPAKATAIYWSGLTPCKGSCSINCLALMHKRASPSASPQKRVLSRPEQFAIESPWCTPCQVREGNFTPHQARHRAITATHDPRSGRAVNSDEEDSHDGLRRSPQTLQLRLNLKRPARIRLGNALPRHFSVPACYRAQTVDFLKAEAASCSTSQAALAAAPCNLSAWFLYVGIPNSHLITDFCS